MEQSSARRRALTRHLVAALLGGGVLGLAIPLPEGHLRDTASRESRAGVPTTRISPPPPAPPPPVTSAAAPEVAPAVPITSGSEPEVAPCPSDMVLVEGEYCTKVDHTCLEWMDDPALPFARCRRYLPKARCNGERRALRYCIDRFESADDDGMPVHHQSLFLADKRCKAQGKRLCTESEWNFACEGELMLPYPYGWERAPKCNQDREDLYENNPRRRVLRDLRQRNDPNSECVSPFGVYNMVGNLDEPVLRDGKHLAPFRTALKGGWWMAGRNRCRPATTAHDDYYKDIQIGVRCCADAQPSRAVVLR